MCNAGTAPNFYNYPAVFGIPTLASFSRFIPSLKSVRMILESIARVIRTLAKFRILSLSLSAPVYVCVSASRSDFVSDSYFFVSGMGIALEKNPHWNQVRVQGPLRPRWGAGAMPLWGAQGGEAPQPKMNLSIFKDISWPLLAARSVLLFSSWKCITHTYTSIDTHKHTHWQYQSSRVLTVCYFCY